MPLHFPGMRVTRFGLGKVAAAIGFLLFLAGCVKPSAIADFAKVSAEAAALFPSIAAIPYEGCVAEAENDQIQQATSFNGDFSFDRPKLEQSCKQQKATEERMERTYAVLSAYVETLAKLAGGSAPTYDTQLTNLAGSIPGLSASQQTAVSGLASVISDAFVKHWRERQAAKAIERAQPHVEVITSLFEEEIPKYIIESLNIQRASLVSVYRDAYQRREGGQIRTTNPVLITKEFAEADRVIEKKRAAVVAFEQIVTKIKDGHTALYKNRNKLAARDTIQELFQTTSSMATQVAAVRGAF